MHPEILRQATKLDIWDLAVSEVEDVFDPDTPVSRLLVSSSQSVWDTKRTVTVAPNEKEAA